MESIRKITQGKYTLKHERFRDSFGLLRDSFQLEVIESDDKRSWHRLEPEYKVLDYDRNRLLHDQTRTFTTDEYVKMLDLAIKEYENICPLCLGLGTIESGQFDEIVMRTCACVREQEGEMAAEGKE